VGIQQAVVDLGTEAVLRYRKISGVHDNELPEQFLGGFIALGLHDRFHRPVHIEHRYTTLVQKTGAQLTPEIINQIGDYRADVTVYDDPPSRPAIIELKVFDEGTTTYAILCDRDKAKKVLKFCKVDLYLGILICETKESLQERVTNLEKALVGKFLCGPSQLARDGKWKWYFGCLAVQD
jgi:hypothetical protein